MPHSVRRFNTPNSTRLIIRVIRSLSPAGVCSPDGKLISGEIHQFGSHIFSQDDAQDRKTVFFDLDFRVARYYRKRVDFLVELQHVGVPPMGGSDAPRLWNCKHDHYNADRKHSRFAVISVGFYFSYSNCDYRP